MIETIVILGVIKIILFGEMAVCCIVNEKFNVCFEKLGLR